MSWKYSLGIFTSRLRCLTLNVGRRKAMKSLGIQCVLYAACTSPGSTYGLTPVAVSLSRGKASTLFCAASGRPSDPASRHPQMDGASRHG